MFTKLLFITFFLPAALFSQTKISGKVINTKNQPLRGISLTLKNTYDGATSDSLGNFSFTTTEKGEQLLEISSSGYRPADQKLILNGQPLVVNFSLKELITELKAVVITAGAFEASDAKKGTVLSSIDVVTTASANADITAAIKTLPGTQQVGESEGLFVRGGTAGETKAFIDGTLVNNFYYSSEPGLAQRGRFNPFLFKGTIFSAGGYSALYGQALSSALILESVDLPEKSSADVAISYLGIGGGFQHLAKDKKSSWGISYNYTDLSLAFKIIKEKPDYFNPPVLHSGDANFRFKTSKTGMVKYYGTFSTTNVGFRYADIDSAGMKDAFTLKNLNMYHNLSWKEKIGKGLRINTGISYSTNRDDITSEFQNTDNIKQTNNNNTYFAFKNFNVITHGHYAEAKVVLEKKLKGLNAIRFGSEYNYSKDLSYIGTTNWGNANTITENLISTFAETDLYITNDIAAKVGVRDEHSSLLNKWNIAPRASLAYKFIDNSQLSFAYGIFYQNPERKYLPGQQGLTFSNATHYILQYQKMSNDRIFRTELFYKKYDNLYKTTTIYGSESALNNNGYGHAQGLEVFLRDKKTIKNFDYWISYSYLDTKRDYATYPSLIEPSFAAKHTASLVMKKFVTSLKTMFNASYTYATGRPYYNIRYDNNAANYKIYDQGRTKDFNSMSISFNYLPNIGKKNPKAFTVFVFSINNVLGADNIYNYNYSYDGRIKQAVTPPAKRFFYLGCFLSFGVDRTDDAINNNL